MPQLIVSDRKSLGRSHRFEHDIVVGRAPSVDFTILDPTVSRKHASVQRVGDAFRIHDLGSGNGTFVNGNRVTEAELSDGDVVQLGGVTLKYDTTVDDNHGSVSLSHPVIDSASAKKADRAELSFGLLSDALLGAVRSKSTRERLEMIYEITHAMSTTLDEDSLLRLILEKLFGVFPQAGLGFIMLRDSEDEEMTSRISVSRDGTPAEMTVSRFMLERVVEQKRGIVTRDAVEDERYSNAKSVQDLQVHSVLCVPIVAHEEVLGVLQLNSPDQSSPFEEDDLALLLGIAGQAAMFLANARLHRRILKHELLEQDLELATKIQAHFLPSRPPEVPGYSFHGSYTAAMKVSGDYYDFVTLTDGGVGVLLGDVSGKGVSAALCMAKLSSEARYQSTGQSSPAQILRYLNEGISRDFSEGMFVTMAFVTLEVGSGKLTVASAGHMPPLMRRASGRIEELESETSVPLGILDDATYEESTYFIEPGDTVVIYTDGVNEAMNAQEEEFGVARLRAVVRGADGPAEGVTSAILGAVKAFLGDMPQNDDITLVSLNRDR